MLFSELVNKVNSTQEKFYAVPLGSVEANGETLVLGEKEVELDELAVNAMGEFLGISTAYLRRSPEDLRDININYWLKELANKQATFQVVGDTLSAVFPEEAKIIPTQQVVNTLSRVFDPSDEVVGVYQDRIRSHFDFVTDRQINVPGIEGVDSRPVVGDITKAGMRIHIYPIRGEKPFIETYMHRLVCSNGLTIPENDLQVSLSGNTVPEILESLEENANRLLSRGEEHLLRYARTADIPVEGSVEQVISQLGRERGLSDRIVRRAIDMVPTLPGEASAYDVMNIFNQLANEGVKYPTKIALQGLSGEIAAEANHVLHRCTNCAHLI